MTEPSHGLDALARVTAVYDGDTWHGYHRPEPRTTVGEMKYRLRGVDTHEIDADYPDIRERARNEKQFVEEWIKQGEEEWDGDWPFRIIYPPDADTKGEGNFGRKLVDLKRRSDDAFLSEAVLNEFDGVQGGY